MKCQTEWVTSWNQIYWKKYQQTQICTCCHSSGRRWRGTKEALDEGERGQWKSWLETPHSKSKIMASSPITSWHVEGEKVEAVTDCIFLGSKITADGNCSSEIKRCLLLGRRTVTNLNSVLKSRNITLPKKVRIVKAMVFPIVMYGCQSWSIKKVEHWRIDSFKLWCWRRLFRVFGQQGDQISKS